MPRPLVLALVPLLLSACAPPPEWKPGRVRAVASFSILGDLAARVGGDDADVRVLAAAGADPHTFEPRPEDGRSVAEAQLVFRIGPGFDPWLDRLYGASGTRAALVEVAPPPPAGLDPHAWLDPRNAIAMAGAIEAAFEKADPGRAASYRKRAQDLVAGLERLDAWIAAETARIPADARRLVTLHDSMGHFARRYGFERTGCAIASASTESADPSASEFAALAGKVRSLGVRAVFPEAGEGGQLMKRLAGEAGVRLGAPLYTDALGPGDASTYEGLMRSNTRALVEALGDPLRPSPR